MNVFQECGGNDTPNPIETDEETPPPAQASLIYSEVHELNSIPSIQSYGSFFSNRLMSWSNQLTNNIGAVTLQNCGWDSHANALPYNIHITYEIREYQTPSGEIKYGAAGRAAGGKLIGIKQKYTGLCQIETDNYNIRKDLDFSYPASARTSVHFENDVYDSNRSSADIRVSYCFNFQNNLSKGGKSSNMKLSNGKIYIEDTIAVKNSSPIQAKGYLYPTFIIKTNNIKNYPSVTIDNTKYYKVNLDGATSYSATASKIIVGWDIVANTKDAMWYDSYVNFVYNDVIKKAALVKLEYEGQAWKWNMYIRDYDVQVNYNPHIVIAYYIKDEDWGSYGTVSKQDVYPRVANVKQNIMFSIIGTSYTQNNHPSPFGWVSAEWLSTLLAYSCKTSIWLSNFTQKGDPVDFNISRIPVNARAYIMAKDKKDDGTMNYPEISMYFGALVDFQSITFTQDIDRPDVHQMFLSTRNPEYYYSVCYEQPKKNKQPHCCCCLKNSIKECNNGGWTQYVCNPVDQQIVRYEVQTVEI